MYEKFFGLVENPFGMAPDPRFFYQSAGHREALAALKYGVEENRRLMALVGDAGTGKTTLIRALEDDLGRSTCCVTLNHTTIDSCELLPSILLEVQASHRQEVGRLPGRGGVVTSAAPSPSRQTRAELIDAFHRFVASESAAFDRMPLLVVDEAQNLSLEALEEVRLLSNVVGPRRKLLRILLSGLPGLEDQLSRPEAGPLRQRVAVRVRLQPLSLEETGEYVLQRLERAGSSDPFVFDADALATIWRAAKGVPRTINAVCDGALVISFAAADRHVSRSVAEEAIRDVLQYPLASGTSVDEALSATGPPAGWPEEGMAQIREALQAGRQERRKAALPAIETALGDLEKERAALLQKLRSDTGHVRDVEAQIRHARERLERARRALDHTTGFGDLQGGGRVELGAGLGGGVAGRSGRPSA